MSPHQIFLLGAYGQNNLGDDALLEVCLARLRAGRLVVNSAQPDQTSLQYGVAAVGTYTTWPRLRRLRALYRSDAIIFGGGSLLKEIEGGVIARLLYFLRIFLVLILARLLGRPTAMLGVGVGPLRRPLYRRLSRIAASLADLVCVRDAESRELLAAIGVRRPVYVTADLVFAQAADPPAPARGPSPAPRPTVAVLPRYSLSGPQLAALAAACDHLVEAHGARITIIPFQTGYSARYDDLPAAQALLAQMRRAADAELLLPASASSAMAAIGAADLVLSTRLHGLIFAAAGGVPMVGIDYELKVRNFMAAVGQPGLCVALDELEAGRLPAVLDAAYAGREAAAAAIRARAAELRASSLENFTRFEELAARPRRGGLLSGGALLLASMTVVNAGNYLFNLLLGRWLGPAAFADLSLIITAFLIVTLITSTLQTISARFAALSTADGDDAGVEAVRAWLSRWAWGLGGATLALFTLGAPLWQRFFHTRSPWPFVILGIGLPFYYAQGIDRGALQGRTRFGALALSYQVEMWVRLACAIALVALGWSVNGAVAGVTLSLVATWLAAGWALDGAGRLPLAGLRRSGPQLGREQRRAIGAYSGPVAAALVGQVLINNSDILIVKHFFAAEAAGHYAALALIGRVVFFATLSVVAAMFPIVAQRHRRGEPHRHLLWLALALVALSSGAVIAAAWAFPALMVQLLFGPAYLPIAPLLWLYAVATMLYALANVVINYRLSLGDGGGSALVIVAGAAQVAGLWLFHQTLQQVVVVQVILMVGLFGALCVWDWRRARAQARPAAPGGWWPQLRRRWRSLLLGTLTLSVLLLMWQVAGAQPARAGNPAQAQLQQIMPGLRDSEAEQASGAYIPGVGAVIVLDLLRGPNTYKDKPADLGVRDWAYYLLGAFGPKLTAVPPDETIAISVSYYDFAARVYHQLVISSRAAAVADSAGYAVWLDGLPANPAAEQQDARQAAAAAPVSDALTLTFDDAQAGADWSPLGGQWAMADGGYAQTELGRYDLVSVLRRPLPASYRLQVDLKHLGGAMGGGIIFNAPDPATKNNAQLVAYAEEGGYLQWGHFDGAGVFQFDGGSPVPSGADGAWHTLAVTVSGGTYQVSLDGALLAEGLPLAGAQGGHAGLFVSTSQVRFDNLTLEAQ